MTLSPLPPDGWAKADFDESRWPRYLATVLVDSLGGYGAMVQAGGRGAAWPVMLCLRTAFGVDDPAAVADLTLSVQCIGGGVVHVNGQEVGRRFVSGGDGTWATAADDYPPEAYTMPDGE